jgi:hypothetical protein
MAASRHEDSPLALLSAPDGHASIAKFARLPAGTYAEDRVHWHRANPLARRSHL